MELKKKKKGFIDPGIDVFATPMNTNKRGMFQITEPEVNSGIRPHAYVIGKHMSPSGIHVTLPWERHHPQN